MNTELQLLNVWRATIKASVRDDGPDLSARQTAILMDVYLQAEAQTVRGLAAAMNISKPAVSRALDRLGQLGFVRRLRDKADRRNVLVQRTVKGSVYLMEFASYIRSAQDQMAAQPMITMAQFKALGQERSDVSLQQAPAGKPAAAPPAVQWANAAD